MLQLSYNGRRLVCVTRKEDGKSIKLIDVTRSIYYPNRSYFTLNYSSILSYIHTSSLDVHEEQWNGCYNAQKMHIQIEFFKTLIQNGTLDGIWKCVSIDLIFVLFILSFYRIYRNNN